MSPRVLLGGLVLFLLPLVGGLALLRQRTTNAVDERPVLTAAAAEGPLPVKTDEASFLGVVIVESAVDLAARLEGRVESVRVRVGTQVRQGELVVTLDSRAVRQEQAIAEAELLSSRAELEVARLALEQAQERLRRRESPEQLRTGALSEEELSAARYEQRMALAKLEVAQGRVAEREARVGQLLQRREETQIVAPFDGVVAGRFVHPGALVQQGQPLVHLLRSGKPQVRFAIPATQLRRVAVGLPVRVEAPQGLVIGGQIVQVAPEVDVASLMVFALADLEPAPGLTVPAGSAVRVRMLAGEAP